MTDIDRAARLSPEKQALLRRRLQGRAARPGGIVPRRPAGDPPLSPVQHGMWVTNQFLETTALYNVPRVLRIDGPLDAAALRRALDALVARHEILRTTYPHPARPVQHIAEPGPAALRTVDLSGVPADRRWDEAMGVARAEIAAPFDLARGPVFRAVLADLGSDGHVLILNTHHIASDDWSCTIMLRELDELYGAAVAGREPDLPPLAAQYADYAAWQSGRLTAGLEHRQLDYWRAALADTPHLLELPTDRPRPAVPSHTGAVVKHTLSSQQSHDIKALATAHGVTVYTVLLASFAITLRHHSGQARFAVGSLVSGRNAAETEPLIGLFANAVALPMDLGGDPSFTELLRRTHAAVLGTFDHQDVTFEQVVAEVKADRTEARNPVYQVLYQCLETSERVAGRLPALGAEPVDPGEQTAKVDLTLTAVNSADSVTLALNYATDLFTAETAERILAHVVNVAVHASAHPGEPVPAAVVLGPDEYNLVTGAWAQNLEGYPRAGSYPLDRTVVDLFRERAAETPDAVAVVCEDTVLTYADLDELTDRIAHRLVERGVARHDVVGVALPRGAELVAAVLGVLKTGAAYLALDPTYPAARLDYVLGDAAARVVIVDSDSADVAIGHRLSYDDLSLPVNPTREPLPGPHPDDLVYVMYTSGSTGRPKGVDINHRGLMNTLQGVVDLFGSGPDDRWLLLTSLSFDPSTLELFVPLITGARVVVVPETARLDGAEQARIAREYGITHIQATPPGWRMLVGAGFEAPHAAAITVGEVMPASLAGEVCARTARLVNAYGPTEVTVYASYADVDADGAPVTDVGRPAAGCRVYVLDDNLDPVPVGAIGEVYVGGPGVAWGYRAKPGLTANRFVPDPFGPPGSRLYRSGDRARFRSDGRIELRGRADHQVKIRGHRVEPGEVEAALLAQPEVDQAAVVARPAPGGGLRLLGYVVPHASSASPTEVERTLRDRLGTDLPAYLVPGRIIVLDRMPLTPTGKVDRKALPEPDVRSAAESREAPRTEAERILAAIWAEVLGRESIGPRDNFFDAGGDSVLAIHVAARAREAGLELTPRQVLTHQELADLAAVATPVAEPAVAGLPAVEPTAADAAPGRPAGSDEVEDRYPLSPLQAGMLFHSLFDPDSTDYVVQFVYAVDPDLDVPTLQRAWDHVCSRHPILRTTFAWDGLDEPVQLVHRHARVLLRELDWRDVPMESVPDRLKAHLAEERERGFDLEHAPPQRLDVIHLADGGHRLVRHAHHILLDGWSAQRVLDEVQTVYRCLRAVDMLPQLPEPVPFRRYIDWLADRDPAAADDYWRGELGDVGAPTPLTILAPERADGVGASHREVAMACADLPAELVASLRATARDLRVTTGSIVHAAWALLLSRYSRTTDVVFGSTVAGRSGAVAGVEDIVGMLINTLPLRARVRRDAQAADWLREVHAKLVELRDFEHCPLVDVQRRSRVAAGQRLFDSILMFENFGPRRERPAAGGLGLTPLHVLEQTGYPLVLNVGMQDTVHLRLDYQSDRVDADTAERLLAHYRMLLEELATRPQTLVGDLPALPPDELREVVEECNVTAAPYPSDLCLHELFEQQADRTPDAVAVVFGDRSLTYRELDERANQLAHHLRGLGVGAESLVGVCFERGLEPVVGLLGVLKAGAAYVPLDPDYPADRLEFMVHDTAAQVVLTHDRTADRLPPVSGEVLCLDKPEDAARIAAWPTQRPERINDPENLAYVIYTSGSTGRPKGTLIRHRGIVNYIWWMHTGFPLAAPDRVLQLAGLSFDISVYEMFWPWSGGATVVLARPDGYRDPQYIVDTMIAEQITSAHVVPSMLRALLPLLDGRRLPLRWLFASAEALTTDILEAWGERCPGTALINMYGATEVSVDSTFWVCDTDAERVSVGRPIANTRVYVFDDIGRPTPVGAAGEGCLAGVSVGRGYHGRPGLTARRFVPDPYGPPGSRLYRTGDLVRRLPDGALEFLGRLDHQVKIRGFRVELGEIEAALLTHPRLAHAAVTARDEERGGKRLVAYVVSKQGDAPTTSELRAHLRNRVPEYMLPAVFVPLPAMPLNPNGKVDRAALPAPETSRPDLQAAYLAPRTRVEEILARVWSEVLGVERVGVHDDFFDLGGDSILSIRVMVAARRAGLSLTPRQMFADPTIAQLAQALEAGAAPSQIHADQGTVGGEVPLTPIQHWFTALKWPDGPYNQSVRLRWNEAVDEAALRMALTVLVRHHDALRLRLSGTQHIVAEESAQLLRVADLSTLTPAETDTAARSAADDLQASLDPVSGPLIRALFLHYGTNCPDEVVIAVHHLAVDTVSWQILLEDLAAAYRGEALAPKTTSFQHWARRLVDYAHSDGFAAEAAYWQQRHEAAALPLDHPGGRNTQGSAITVTRTLDPAATEALLRSAHPAYRTRVDELLLAALARTLARHTGRGDIHIDLEGHGREQLFDDVDLSRTVGWFTAIHPLRLSLSDPDDTSRAVKAVKEHLRGTPHRGVGYGIARYLRGLDGQWPDASVSFNYHGQVRTAAESGLFSRIPALGAERDPEGVRPYPLDINAAVIDGALTVHWTYSTTLHDPATVEALADAYLGDLTSVLDHCRNAAPRSSASRSSHSDVRAYLDRLFPGVPATRMRMARHGVPGLGVAIVADGAVVDAWGEGVTHAHGAPVRSDTVFQAGSVSKHVTTLGVLSLVRSGVLELDEDIDRYLRSWRPEHLDPARPVTLRTLLSHTAGMSEDQFDGAGARRPDQPVPGIADVLSGHGSAATRPVRAELRPGERFRYSGNHFVVVEQIMTDATGRPFPDLMHDLVFEPLGMRDSGYGTPFARTRAAALGHAADGTPIDGGWRVYPDATGGLWVSVGDLARVALEIQQALAGTGSVVLDKALAVEMLTPAHPAAAYGLGTVLRAADGVCWFGHSGETAGYRCYTAVGVESGAGVVLAANGDAGGDLIIDLLAEFGLGMQVWVDRGTGAPRRPGR